VFVKEQGSEADERDMRLLSTWFHNRAGAAPHACCVAGSTAQPLSKYFAIL
jgi:hypothetical protein